MMNRLVMRVPFGVLDDGHQRAVFSALQALILFQPLAGIILGNFVQRIGELPVYHGLAGQAARH